MRRKQSKRPSFEDLEKLAYDVRDIRPLSAAMRRRWEAAKKTDTKSPRGRPRKDPRHKARIVPISIDPELLAQADRFAKSVGVTRSKLVAEALRLRIKS
ncbi:MAG TPA: hypothetical protein VN541_15015 [Tepidisphaeraceae bacterium]|nr:hypothetical protein [Tepidisphaeraceae bacterium]